MELWQRWLARYLQPVTEARALLASYLVHVFIFQEEDIGVHTMLPKLLYVFKPGPIAHLERGEKESGTMKCGVVLSLSWGPQEWWLTLVIHEASAELLERSSVAHGPQRTVELIVGDHQVLGVTCHVDDLEHEGETSFQQLLYLLPGGFLVSVSRCLCWPHSTDLCPTTLTLASPLCKAEGRNRWGRWLLIRRGDVSSCGHTKISLVIDWWMVVQQEPQPHVSSIRSWRYHMLHYLYDVQARLGVLQHRQLLIDVHEADLIWVGSLTHQIDDLLK